MPDEDHAAPALVDQAEAPPLAPPAGNGDRPPDPTATPKRGRPRNPGGKEWPLDAQGYSTNPEAVRARKRAKRDGPARARASRARSSEPAAPRATTKQQRTKQIAKQLAQLLTLPALPAKMAGADAMTYHFVTQGPRTAQELAALSEEHEPLREILERMMSGGLYGTLLILAVGYLGPPLLYLGGMQDRAVSLIHTNDLSAQLADADDAEALAVVLQQATDAERPETPTGAPGGPEAAAAAATPSG